MEIWSHEFLNNLVELEAFIDTYLYFVAAFIFVLFIIYVNAIIESSFIVVEFVMRE